MKQLKKNLDTRLLAATVLQMACMPVRFGHFVTGIRQVGRLKIVIFGLRAGFGVNIGLREHFATIFRHWGMIAAITVITVLIAGAVAFLSSKTYVAASRILILNSSQVERATKSSFNDGRNLSSPQEQVLTQVAILKSPLLAERLALQIGPQQVLDEMAWRWDGLRKLPSKLKDRLLLAMNGWPPTANLIALAGIKPPAAKAGGPPVRDATKAIMDGLIAEAITKTEMFAVGFKAPSPEFAAEVVNGLVDIYITHVVELRSPSGTAEIAQKEVERLRVDLQQAETTLEEFTQQQDIFAISQQKSLLIDRLARIQDALAAARLSTVETDQKVAIFETRIAELSDSGPLSVTRRPNPLVDRLGERLSRLQTEVKRFVPGSSSERRISAEIKNIEAQLASVSTVIEGTEISGENNVQQQLRATLALEQAQRQALSVRSAFIERQLETAQAELRRLDSHENRYRTLRRQVETKEQAYRFAVQKREETAIAQLLTESSLAQVVQVEPATPPKDPSAPRRAFLLVLGLVVGLMSGTGMAYVLEFRRKTMSTPQEVEIALRRTTLAAIDRTGFLARNSEKNEIEYRRLAARLLGRFGNATPASLIFCSADDNPAQTGVVEQVSLALCRQGQNILQVKIRPLATERPSTLMPNTPEPGAEPAVHHAIIEAAPWALNREIAAALDPVQGQYDYVLLDMPDPNRFPEQFLVAASVAAVILVVEADRTRTEAAANVAAQYEAAGASTLSVLLNNRRFTKSSWAFCWQAAMRQRQGARSVEAAGQAEI